MARGPNLRGKTTPYGPECQLRVAFPTLSRPYHPNMAKEAPQTATTWPLYSPTQSSMIHPKWLSDSKRCPQDSPRWPEDTPRWVNLDFSTGAQYKSILVLSASYRS
jgi:hypothetical protein